jgi:hypothetical protein
LDPVDVEVKVQLVKLHEVLKLAVGAATPPSLCDGAPGSTQLPRPLARS